MKINWFSPLPPASSEIANYTFRLLPSLAEKAEIFLWTNQDTWDSELKKYGKVCSYQIDQIPWFQINQSDLNIYHLGNNAKFHQEIWQISRQCSGLVILHDYKLQHFFSMIYQKNPNEYLKQMEYYYGKEGQKMAQLVLKNRVSIDFMADNYPLTALALENATGVITHSQFVYEKLKQENQWITALMPLPYESSRKIDTPISKFSPPYRLIIFGYLGINRCLNIILNALATFPHKEQFKLDIYGKIEQENKVHHQIAELGLEKFVKIHGFVSEEELNTALSQAHLALNLRYPTMGEASASQLRIWSYALPSLVTQVGWYAELPKDSVAFVRPHHDIEDIHIHLQNFITDPHFYQQLGQRGQHILQQHHRYQLYAKSLLEVSEKVQQLKYRSLADQFAKSVGNAMSLWSQDHQGYLNDTTVAEAIRFYTQ